MDITGTLIFKREAEQVSDKFKKREFIVKIDESSQYPQEVSFQLSQDKCGLIDSIAVGTQVQVFFNLRGRKWINKEGVAVWFNTMDCWRVVNATGTTEAPKQEEAQPHQAFDPNNSSDLPF